MSAPTSVFPFKLEKPQDDNKPAPTKTQIYQYAGENPDLNAETHHLMLVTDYCAL